MSQTRPDPTDVLRIRRHRPTRREGFVDASFACAVTLLVISVGHVRNYSRRLAAIGTTA